MEVINNLLTRLRHTAPLLLIGFILIIYIAFGFVYWQQGAEQEKHQGQITKLTVILSKSLPSSEKLQAEYEEVNRALAPMVDEYAVFTLLVGIAEKSGIDIDPDAGKVRIPPYTSSQAKVGGGTYQLLSFKGIYVQADYDKVMAFISDLDSGKTLENMVLSRVDTSQIEVWFGGEEGARRAEFRNVASAVADMIDKNGLSKIPNPMNFAGGVATNLMGDDPDTEATAEGFPDITTTAARKGYTGTDSPRDGYVLYEHDRISTDNTSKFETVNYITMLTTNYYYTCEADGTVRQFDGASVFTATEYLGSKAFKMETVVTVNVNIYTKPGE